MVSSASSTALGDFLCSSRARLTPERAGLAFSDDRRRVAGLRREELAMLAGVSVSYYTRLEQGQSRGASAQILDALASALRLTETERGHLRLLAEQGSRPPRARRAPEERPDPALVELLDSSATVPMLILGRRNDVLAWNRLGHALVAGHLDFDAPGDAGTRPNMTRLIFLDPEMRSLYADWDAKSRAVVGNLRLTAARYPDDAQLAGLIGSLTMSSPEFATLWADHRVQPCATAIHTLQHPSVGAVTVTQQTLRAVDAPDQCIVTHTAPADHPSQAALQLLERRSAGTPDQWSQHTSVVDRQST